MTLYLMTSAQDSVLSVAGLSFVKLDQYFAAARDNFCDETLSKVGVMLMLKLEFLNFYCVQ
jgi:hypothetical protein